MVKLPVEMAFGKEAVDSQTIDFTISQKVNPSGNSDYASFVELTQDYVLLKFDNGHTID